MSEQFNIDDGRKREQAAAKGATTEAPTKRERKPKIPAAEDAKIGTVEDACRVIGGQSSPISKPTYYRGVKAGRYNGPFHPSPGVSRVDLVELRDRLGASQGK